VSVRERWRAMLEWLVEASAAQRTLISLASLLAAVFVGTVLILVAGRATTCAAPDAVYYGGVGFCYDPIEVYDRLFLGALGDPLAGRWDPLNRQLAITLRETTVLVFTGLSVAIAFRAGIFNIGTQGQLIAGALATAVVVLWASGFVSGALGTVLLLPLGVGVGALSGGLYGAIPGALKAYADANEVITTIMLNFVASLIALYLVREIFKDPASPANQTVPLPEFAQFPAIIYNSSFGFSILALATGGLAVAGLYYLIERTTFGFDVQTSGVQPRAAEFGGVDARRTIVASMSLSGALGGVGGACYVMMILGHFQAGVPSYGFDGITVAILGGNNPVGVALAAFLFGVLQSGSTVIQLGTKVPPQLAGVLRGLIILFVAMPEFFRLLGRRVVPPEPPEERATAADGGTGRGGDDE